MKHRFPREESPDGNSVNPTDEILPEPNFQAMGPTALVQFRVGFDLWSGMTWLQYGLAQTFAFSLPKTAQDHTLQPGIEYRTVFSLGHTIEETAKISLGISRLFTDEKNRKVAHQIIW